MNLDAAAGKSCDDAGQYHPSSFYWHSIKSMIAHGMFGCHVSSPAKHCQGQTQQQQQKQSGEGPSSVSENERTASFQTIVKAGSLYNEGSEKEAEYDGIVGDGGVCAKGNGHELHRSGATTEVNDHTNMGNRNIAMSSIPIFKMTSAISSGLTPRLTAMEAGSYPKVPCSAVNKPVVSMESQERAVISSSSSDKLVAAGAMKRKMGHYNIGGTNKRKNTDREDSSPRIGNTHPFEEGQHVFVVFQKTQYPAVIVSVGHQMAWVRWSITGTLEEVEVENLRPMFEVKNGYICSSSYSVRNRQPTNRYAPLLNALPSKQINSERYQTLESKRNKSMGQLKVHPGSKEARMPNNLDSSGNSDFPPGAAPSLFVPSKKRMKTDRYSLRDWAAKISRVDSDYVIDDLPSSNHSAQQSSHPSNELPPKRTRLTTDRYSPPESLSTKQSTRPSTDSSGQLKLTKATRTKTLDSRIAPDSGREAASLIEAGWRTTIHWTSPSGKRFRCLRRALRFQRMKRQSNGDEEKAWVLYKQMRVTRMHSSKISLPTMNRCQEKNKAARNVTPESREIQVSRSSDDRRGKKNSYSKTNKGLSKTAAQASTEMQTRPRELSHQDESEYKSLWHYYMSPVVRGDEELSSGMVLRNKHAKCSLLRSKGSMFRQALHRRLSDLEKKGERGEILNMLREMRHFDMSMQSGDGPPPLVAKLIGPQLDTSEIEVLDSIAIHRNQTITHEATLVDLSSSCGQSAQVHVSENAKDVLMPSAVVTNQVHQDVAPTSLKNNVEHTDMALNLLGASAAKCHNEVIDLDAQVNLSSSCTQSDKGGRFKPPKINPQLASLVPLTAQYHRSSETCTASQGVEVALPNSKIIDLCEDEVEDISSQSGEVIDLLDDDDAYDVIIID